MGLLRRALMALSSQRTTTGGPISVFLPSPQLVQDFPR